MRNSIAVEIIPETIRIISKVPIMEWDDALTTDISLISDIRNK